MITDHTAFLLVAGFAALLVGLSKGGMSNLAGLATPVLALAISPLKAAALLLPIFVISDVVALWSYRRDFDRRNLSILIPAGVSGVCLGWVTAAQVSEKVVALLIGLLGVVFCINAWRARHTSPVPKPAVVSRGIFWGMVMGFSSFVSHSGGTPYQVYVLPQNLPKVVFAGTTTIVFAVINAVKLIPYWFLGQFNADNLKTSIVLMPIAVVGTLVGVRLVRVLPARSYFLFVHAMLFVVSIKLIWDSMLAIYGVALPKL
jgi:uncharacterized protein